MNFTHKEIKKLLQEADSKKTQMITQCQNRDRQAFDQFVKTYQDDVFSHVYRRLGNQKKAMHTTCDIFVEAYKAFPEFHGNVSVKVWLFRIAEQHLHGALRGRKRIRVQEESLKKQPHTEPEEGDSEEIGGLLVEYLDGSLDPVDVDRIEKQLEENPEYRQKYEELQRTDALLRRSVQLSAPQDLADQINAKITKELSGEKITDKIRRGFENIKTSIPQLFASRPMISFAVSLMIIFGGIVIYQQIQIGILSTQIQSMERSIQRSAMEDQPGDMQPEQFENTTIILTGALKPDTLTYEEAEQITSLTSEPEQTKFCFISGDIEQIKTLIEAMPWKVRKDHQYQQDNLTVRRIIVEIPHKEEPTPIEIFIIAK